MSYSDIYKYHESYFCQTIRRNNRCFSCEDFNGQVIPSSAQVKITIENNTNVNLPNLVLQSGCSACQSGITINRIPDVPLPTPFVDGSQFTTTITCSDPFPGFILATLVGDQINKLEVAPVGLNWGISDNGTLISGSQTSFQALCDGTVVTATTVGDSITPAGLTMTMKIA